MSGKALIGFGSNLGDREGNIRRGARLLESRGLEVIAFSSLLATKPEEGVGGGPFLNAAGSFRAGAMPPLEILGLCRDVERELGRRTKGDLAPRTLDLDIFLLDDKVIEEEGLRIPHPRFHCRLFALIPAAEIEPDWIHPVRGLPLRELMKRARNEKGLKK